MTEHFNNGKSTSVINDPVDYIVVGERGVFMETTDRATQFAYPDICKISYGMRYFCPSCGDDTASSCTNASSIVGTCTVSKSDIKQFWHDPSARSKWTRHMGGNNFGFADGHAAWIPADTLIAGYGTAGNPRPVYETPLMCMCYCPDQ
jgi:prepilin-type processing-associated H-X9-DG protein